MKRYLLKVAVLTLLFLLPAFSYAGTTCALATQLVADGRQFSFDFVAAPGGVNNYAFAAVAGRSYSVEIRDEYDDVTTNISTSILAGTCPGSAITGIQDASAVEPQVPANATRMSFIAAVNEIVQIAVTNNDPSNGKYIGIKVADTTLFNPGWSTFGGFNGFYAIMNTTSSPLTGTLTFYDGVSGAVVKAVPISLTAVGTAGAIAGVNTGPSSLNVPVNHFGYATFAYIGPPGAVQINNSIANFSVNAIQPGTFLPARQ